MGHINTSTGQVACWWRWGGRRRARHGWEVKHTHSLAAGPRAAAGTGRSATLARRRRGLHTAMSRAISLARRGLEVLLLVVNVGRLHKLVLGVRRDEQVRARVRGAHCGGGEAAWRLREQRAHREVSHGGQRDKGTGRSAAACASSLCTRARAGRRVASLTQREALLLVLGAEQALARLHQLARQLLAAAAEGVR